MNKALGKWCFGPNAEESSATEERKAKTRKMEHEETLKRYMYVDHYKRTRELLLKSISAEECCYGRLAPRVASAQVKPNGNS